MGNPVNAPETRSSNGWRIAAIVLAVLLVIVTVVYALGVGWRSFRATSGDAILTAWEKDADSRKQLISYMEAITNKNGPDYIPPEDRIAVFDMDGTLFCETDPIYFDHMLFMYRVLEDPAYKDKATKFELEVAAKCQSFIDTGKYPADLDNAHGQGVASAFSGMTLKEFNDYVKAFRERPAPGYNNMKLGDGFYVPMVQVVDYLQANDFKVYVVSGTDRLIVRGLLEGKLDIPPSQLIGSDETVVAGKQGDADGLEYVYEAGDDLILGGDFIIKNLKMNKVTVIMQEIGQQPVLSFGNSTGDASMAEFVTSGNPYRSLAFMLCCDDTVRENGNEEKAQKMVDLCEEFDWVPVSMKNDWTTIYGDGVTRK